MAKPTENWLGSIGGSTGGAGKDRTGIDRDGDGFTNDLESSLGADPDDASSTPSPSLSSKLAARLVGVDGDMDGVPDSEEVDNNLDAKRPDTDRDGCSDGAEIVSGSDPLNAADKPFDRDGDCLSDNYEQGLGLSPKTVDTDHDGLNDAVEVAIRSDALNADTDGDGILDGKEFEIGSDPTKKD